MVAAGEGSGTAVADGSAGGLDCGNIGCSVGCAGTGGCVVNGGTASGSDVAAGTADATAVELGCTVALGVDVAVDDGVALGVDVAAGVGAALGCSLPWKKRSTIPVGRAVGSVSVSVGNATLLVAAATLRPAPVWLAGNQPGAKLLATAQPAALTPARRAQATNRLSRSVERRWLERCIVL